MLNMRSGMTAARVRNAEQERRYRSVRLSIVMAVSFDCWEIRAPRISSHRSPASSLFFAIRRR